MVAFRGPAKHCRRKENAAFLRIQPSDTDCSLTEGANAAIIRKTDSEEGERRDDLTARPDAAHTRLSAISYSLTLLMTRCSARLVSLLSGKVEGSKYCGAYSSNHSGRTSVTVRMNWAMRISYDLYQG